MQCNESNLCSKGQIRCQVCTHDTASATHDQLALFFVYRSLLDYLLKNSKLVHDCRQIFIVAHLVLEEGVPDVFCDFRRSQDIVTTFLVVLSVDGIAECIPVIPDQSESA